MGEKYLVIHRDMLTNETTMDLETYNINEAKAEAERLVELFNESTNMKVYVCKVSKEWVINEEWVNQCV